MKLIEAVIFDTDGVVTRTAAVHFAAWKAVFDPFLAAHAPGDGARPFTDADYRDHVDGIPRYDGVAALLASRGVTLAWGEPSDPPGDTTVCAVGNTKNAAFRAVVQRDGVEAYRTTARFVEHLRAAGIRTAVISASRNCAMVLEAAGVAALFEVRVDGNDAAELGFAGKPDPAVFLEAARRLGVAPERAAVVEDAVSGVEAARLGGFALVVGIDRTRHPGPLAEHADLVVPDAADLEVTGSTIHRSVPARARLTDLPAAIDDAGSLDLDLLRRVDGRAVAVFLDYDGTLTPIVGRPEDALLPAATLAAVEALSAVAVVGIISGRDLDDVRAFVAAEGLWFAGSHGFDVLSPTGERREFPEGEAARPALDVAEGQLAGVIGAFEGAWVERKRFAIAVHHRAMAPELTPSLREAVATVAAGHDELRMTGGKMIFELRPAVEWDKGKALHWLLDAAGLDPDTTTAVYVGDDETDEDAFDAVRDIGIGVVAGDEDRETAAHYRLDDPDRVRGFLEALAAWARR